MGFVENVNNVANADLGGIMDNIEDIQNAEGNSWEALAAKMTSNSYAVEAEDIPVKLYTSNDDGTFTATDTNDFSALHWAAKSLDGALLPEDVEGLHNLMEIQEDSQDPTGFDRNDFTTFPFIEYCKDDTVGYIRIDQLGGYSEHPGTTWSDGSPLVTDTYCIRPADGQPSYSFYFMGKKHIISDAQYIALPNITPGVKILVFNSNSLLEFATGIHDAIVDKVIVSIAYHNGVEAILVADERHGKEMNSIDHERIHLTTGAVFETGFIPAGFTTGDLEYSQIGSGIVWDEDIKLSLETQAQSPHYFKGADGSWFNSAADSKFSKLDAGVAQYNKLNTTSGDWEVLDLVDGKFGMTHFMATNDAKYPICKVMGQKVYANITDARSDVVSQIRQIDGLPIPEFVILYSVIFDSTGALQEVDTAGNTYMDFRFLNGAGVGGSSSSTSIHNDLAGRDTNDAHPISAITGLQEALEDATPTGLVVINPVETIPDGFLECNGAELSKTTYADLYGVIGTQYGGTSTTFRLPELRGEFVRGWDNGRGADDSGRGIGSRQSDAIRNIAGGFGGSYGQHPTYFYASGAFSAVKASNYTHGSRYSGGYNLVFDASRQVPTAAQNRPRNVAMMYCIKY